MNIVENGKAGFRREDEVYAKRLMEQNPEASSEDLALKIYAERGVQASIAKAYVEARRTTPKPVGKPKPQASDGASG